MAQMMRLCIDASHLETIAIKVIKERGWTDLMITPLPISSGRIRVEAAYWFLVGKSKEKGKRKLFRPFTLLKPKSKLRTKTDI